MHSRSSLLAILIIGYAFGPSVLAQDAPTSFIGRLSRRIQLETDLRTTERETANLQQLVVWRKQIAAGSFPDDSIIVMNSRTRLLELVSPQQITRVAVAQLQNPEFIANENRLARILRPTEFSATDNSEPESAVVQQVQGLIELHENWMFLITLPMQLSYADDLESLRQRRTDLRQQLASLDHSLANDIVVATGLSAIELGPFFDLPTNDPRSPQVSSESGALDNLFQRLCDEIQSNGEQALLTTTGQQAEQQPDRSLGDKAMINFELNKENVLGQFILGMGLEMVGTGQDADRVQVAGDPSFRLALSKSEREPGNMRVEVLDQPITIELQFWKGPKNNRSAWQRKSLRTIATLKPPAPYKNGGFRGRYESKGEGEFLAGDQGVGTWWLLKNPDDAMQWQVVIANGNQEDPADDAIAWFSTRPEQPAPIPNPSGSNESAGKTPPIDLPLLELAIRREIREAAGRFESSNRPPSIPSMTDVEILISLMGQDLIDELIAIFDNGALIQQYQEKRLEFSNRLKTETEWSRATTNAELHTAASKGDIAVATWLLNQGASVDFHNPKSRETPLFAAVNHGKREMAKQLIQAGADPFRSAGDQRTPLSIAAQQDPELAIEMIAAHRTYQLNKKLAGDSYQPTDREVQAVNAFRQRWQRMNERQMERALINAAKNGYQHLAMELIDAGVNVDAMNAISWSAFYIAMREQHTDLALRLLQRGAEPFLKTADQRQGLHLAAEFGTPQIVEAILQHDVNLDATDQFGMTPLHYACRAGNVGIAGQLLAAGASPDLTDHKGYRSLHWALKNNRLDLLVLLVTAGAAAEISWNPPPQALIENKRGELLLEKIRISKDDPLHGFQYDNADARVSAAVRQLFDDQIFAAIALRPGVLEYDRQSEFLFGNIKARFYRELLCPGGQIPNCVLLLFASPARDTDESQTSSLRLIVVYQFSNSPAIDAIVKSLWKRSKSVKNFGKPAWRPIGLKEEVLVQLDDVTLALGHTSLLSESRTPLAVLPDMLDSMDPTADLRAALSWGSASQHVINWWNEWATHNSIPIPTDLPAPIRSASFEIDRFYDAHLQGTIQLRPESTLTFGENLKTTLAAWSLMANNASQSAKLGKRKSPHLLQSLVVLLEQANLKISGSQIQIRSPTEHASTPDR
jgi:ankyrin repeat protein